jgi:hypothetical protein
VELVLQEEAKLFGVTHQPTLPPQNVLTSGEKAIHVRAHLRNQPWSCLVLVASSNMIRCSVLEANDVRTAAF